MDMVKKLINIFKGCVVLSLKDIMTKLSRSRTSVIDYLNEIGYFSSYNAAGEFYTLRDIPTFDSNGIWKYDQAYFSVHGSLRDTVVALVKDSMCGYTHEELRDILGIRMYNTLQNLTKDGKIIRQEVGGKFVYFSLYHQEEQFEQRRITPPKLIEKPKVIKQRAPRLIPPAGLYETIEVLVAFINGYNEPEMVYQYVHRNGIHITPEQIKSIFATYELGKKNCTLRS
jgi:hypothetical protein